MVNLSDFVGEHQFSGIDFITIENGAQGILFVLNAFTYLVIEDKADGYRSMLESIDFAPLGAVVKNEFRPHWVEARISLEPREDILIFYDRFTELPVLTIGTNSDDSYYPSFVCDYQPENLMDNHIGSNHSNIIWIDVEL